MRSLIVRKLLQILNTITLILSQKFFQNCVLIKKAILNFLVIKKTYHYALHHHCHTLAAWILPYWKLRFSSRYSKIFESQKPLGTFCWELQKKFSTELLVNEINGIINADKFSDSFDDLYCNQISFCVPNKCTPYVCERYNALLVNVLSFAVWHLIAVVSLAVSEGALCRLRGCKNRPAPFPGQMSYKATKPGLVFVFIS